MDTMKSCTTRSFLFLLILLLTACSTYQIKQPTRQVRDFGRDIRIVVTGGESSDISKRLDSYLREALTARGYNVSGDENVTNLIVTITKFDTGNQAIRVILGHPGQALLVYNAKYIKGDKILAEIDADERFSGYGRHLRTKKEPFRALGGAETVTTILLEETTKHIVALTPDMSTRKK